MAQSVIVPNFRDMKQSENPETSKPNTQLSPFNFIRAVYAGNPELRFILKISGKPLSISIKTFSEMPCNYINVVHIAPLLRLHFFSVDLHIQGKLCQKFLRLPVLFNTIGGFDPFDSGQLIRFSTGY